MRIESVAAQADRAGRYLVRFDDGSSMRLYRQTVGDFALYAGLELTAQQIDDLRIAAGKMSAKMRAVRIVAASNVSRKDLEQRLVQKGEDPRQAREAVQWMEDLDLVDDRKTAQALVQQCISKGYGCARAKQALYEKKIPKELWDEVLEDYPDQSEAILAFLRSRLQGSREMRDVKRVTDALLRRGHSYSAIRRGLEQVLPNADEFPEE